MLQLELLIKRYAKYIHYIIAILAIFFVITVVGNFQIFITKQSLSNFWDNNEETSVFGAFVWNSLLLLLLIAQHSLMASNWFKQNLSSWLNITISQRLLYITLTGLVIKTLITQWISIPEVYLWFIDTQRYFMLCLFFYALHVLGWLVIGLELYLVDLPELLGLSQIYCYYKDEKPPLAEWSTMLREIYSRMRHPGVLVLTTLLWMHPLMTLDRLLLACTLTCYMIGRHSFDDRHCKFAKRYFWLETTHTKSYSSYSYDLS